MDGHLFCLSRAAVSTQPSIQGQRWLGRSIAPVATPPTLYAQPRHKNSTYNYSSMFTCRGEFGKLDDRESYFHLEPLDKENPSVRSRSTNRLIHNYSCYPFSWNRCMHSPRMRFKQEAVVSDTSLCHWVYFCAFSLSPFSCIRFWSELSPDGFCAQERPQLHY